MRTTAISISVGLLLAGCQPQPLVVDLAPRLQAMVDSAVEDYAAVHGAAVHVDAPAIGLSWEGAAGFADPASGSPMTPETPVRIASNTKTFVAAAVLRLAEEDRLGIDDPIAECLPGKLVQMLEDDGYDTSAMTLRHLLTHTSGLFDHSAPASYTEAIVADPEHQWTRSEQVAGAMEWGDPHGGPGEYYTYCDTGYVLLGAVIEEATGRPLAEAVRALVGFDRLGLTSTWWEIVEPEPEGVADRAHQFYGEVDTHAFAPFFDLYGGGGLVSTVGDMARFYRALFNGSVFSDPSTISTMLSNVDGAVALPEGGPTDYRMGIWLVEVAGYETWRHTGFFGTLATYVPHLDLTIAVTVNQNRGGKVMNDVVAETVRLVSQADD